MPHAGRVTTACGCAPTSASTEAAATAVPICDLDGREMLSSDSTGMSELMIVHEEHAIPVFTNVSPPEMAMLTCVGGAGLGMATTNVPVELASDVVIFGAGPVGLSALQGAKLKGASRLIVVEPIAYRRELAMQLGATHVLDPNQYERTPRTRPPNGFRRDDSRFDDTLVDHIRDLCRQPTDRFWAGGGRNGPDHVLEAAGGDQVPPTETAGPTRPASRRCSRAGTSARGRVRDFVHHWPAGGRIRPDPRVAVRRQRESTGGSARRAAPTIAADTPRYVRLMETGQLDMQALVGRTYPLTETTEAYQACADRTLIATVVTPNA